MNRARMSTASIPGVVPRYLLWIGTHFLPNSPV